jgi:hypothetical protein
LANHRAIRSHSTKPERLLSRLSFNVSVMLESYLAGQWPPAFALRTPLSYFLSCGSHAFINVFLISPNTAIFKK